MIQVTGSYHCPECKIVHSEQAQCECGACLYANAKQVIESYACELGEGDHRDCFFCDGSKWIDENETGPIYPIFECKLCTKRHFWD